MARKKRKTRKVKWGKIGAPRSSKRKAFLKKAAGKRRKKRR